jgi:hypothetical protein
MDIYIEKKLNIQKLIPFILLIVIAIIIFIAFRLLTQKQEVTFNLTPLPVPVIDYAFLTSPEFEALDVFPQYTIFIPTETVTPGRSNPFSPLSK